MWRVREHGKLCVRQRRMDTTRWSNCPTVGKTRGPAQCPAHRYSTVGKVNRCSAAWIRVGKLSCADLLIYIFFSTFSKHRSSGVFRTTKPAGLETHNSFLPYSNWLIRYLHHPAGKKVFLLI